MAKRVRDAVLDSPTARAKLKVQGKPYFRSIDRGLHLGYRKGKHGGTWIVRRYLGAEKYAIEALGGADDRQDADGQTILTFHQAQDRARDHVRDVAERDRVAGLGPAITIKSAVEDYLAARDARESKDKRGVGLKRDARSRLTKYVLSDAGLADKSLATVTVEDFTRWRTRIGSSLADGSVRRTANDFKAALNAVVKIHGAKLPADITTTVRSGLATSDAMAPSAREAQVLPDADVRRLITAAGEVDEVSSWDGALHRLVLVLAATGARFSQIARMTVADVQVAQGRLMVPVSRKGQGSKTSSRKGVRVGPDVLDALRPALAGRKGPEPLFLRPRWRMVKVGQWEKIAPAPWLSSAELTRPWKGIVARAGLPTDVVPYALRHSSIVRGLRANLPVRLVAALHDTSSAMIERHYSAFIVDAMDELSALAIVPLTSPAPAQLRSVG